MQDFVADLRDAFQLGNFSEIDQVSGFGKRSFIIGSRL